MKIRKLTRFVYEIEIRKRFIEYAYYVNGKYTGEYESGYLTEDELYKALEPYLIKRKDKIGS